MNIVYDLNPCPKRPFLRANICYKIPILCWYLLLPTVFIILSPKHLVSILNNLFIKWTTCYLFHRPLHLHPDSFINEILKVWQTWQKVPIHVSHVILTFTTSLTETASMALSTSDRRIRAFSPKASSPMSNKRLPPSSRCMWMADFSWFLQHDTSYVHKGRQHSKN